ncbi:hypothetical protein AYO21_01123 [Fonsecaea monophora]|uniref:TauD/TfdA-like domain-containing protein n=2 Tax=Fonsecaea TaxID=40354 RepID=A0A0D2F0M5_9EURO|nr:uncharacterized protein Z517_06812 [Fonsecaea pedrosoi CBS 271.37]XP_022516585.1 hypothetical protein AYO21_01123 [Fonsecaea monophora]KIW80197.1 hypothetical protein Z517_06812 [Fonsecaea pedrosoi CBS 271.37]OAG44633.1 hypothetical protein AYO21_01123 [Fonsecaea monophora]
MPHAVEFNLIEVKELHPTFGAEVSGVDFSRPVPEDVFQELWKAVNKYGVLVFRHAKLNDELHIQFSERLGELDDVLPHIQAGRPFRFKHKELFDVGNIEEDNSLVKPGSHRWYYGKGNNLFHHDSSFNPRRAGLSLLRAHEIPPPGQGLGGNTDFADCRAAYDDLPEDLKKQLDENDYVVCHSLLHSRRKAAPEYFTDVNPDKGYYSRHKIVQTHERSGRKTLYIGNHMHHVEGLPEKESTELINRILEHACQDKYVLSVEWQNPGDLILWDNTSVMHRAHGGAYEGKYRRDMRRTTVHDDSSYAWGLNEKTSMRVGLP